MTQISIAVAQFAVSRNVAHNTEVALSLIAQAAGKADLVVLPENALYSDPAKEAPNEKYSEPLDGPYVSALQAAAREHRIHVVSGMTEPNGDDPRPFNTLVHINADGELDGTYRKIHLYDAFGYRESDTVSPAPITEPLVFDVNGVKVGAATCYDLRFPEVFRWLVDHGADVVALPANWISGPMKEAHWETLARARAIENTIYFAACGQTGPVGSAQSMLIDPLGVVLASAGEGAETIAFATIDTERIDAVRRTNPSLANRQFSVAAGVPR